MRCHKVRVAQGDTLRHFASNLPNSGWHSKGGTPLRGQAQCHPETGATTRRVAQASGPAALLLALCHAGGWLGLRTRAGAS